MPQMTTSTMSNSDKAGPSAGAGNWLRGDLSDSNSAIEEPLYSHGSGKVVQNQSTGLGGIHSSLGSVDGDTPEGVFLPSLMQPFEENFAGLEPVSDRQAPCLAT